MKSPVEVPPAQAIWRDRRAQALLLAATLTIMANATISPALPGLAREFADHPQVALLTRLLVPAPSLAVVLVAPLVGVLSDRIGRRGHVTSRHGNVTSCHVMSRHVNVSDIHFLG